MDKRVIRDIAEGKLRAAQMRATLTDAQRAQVDTLVASVPELLTRTFCGPDNGKGRQAFFILPKGN